MEGYCLAGYEHDVRCLMTVGQIDAAARAIEGTFRLFGAVKIPTQLFGNLGVPVVMKEVRRTRVLEVRRA